MTTTLLSAPTQLRLQPFDVRLAGVVADWTSTRLELHLLAPSTRPPLTAAKVLAWKKVGGVAVVLHESGAPSPIGYAEINTMRRCARHYWLGHIVVDPSQRGRGIGRRFVGMLLDHAFGELHADRVSLIVFPENAPAIRCYTSAGFSEVGEEHHSFNGATVRLRLLRLEARYGA